MYVFISHSSKNADVAKELCTILEANGSDCFLAPRDIRAGHEYATEIMNGLERSDAVLLILSKHTMSSPHVLREIERAVSKSIPIIVYKLEQVELTKSYEYFLRSNQWLDAEECRYDALLSCIDDMKSCNDSKDNTSDDTSLSPDSIQKRTTFSSQTKKRKKIALLSATVVIALLLLAVFFLYLPKSPHEQIKPGDSIVLGTYHNTEIIWKVLEISDDGKEALLVSKDILTFKAFDGADSGKANTAEDTPEFSGSNQWNNSTIRTWLNSDRDYVQYADAAPTDLAMSDGCNGYDIEPGFLYYFTNKELSAIITTTNITNGVATDDKVFLLSMNDLTFFEKAGVSLLAIPTVEAIAQNESEYYSEYCQGVFHVESSGWWLRDGVDNSHTECYQVGHGAKDDENIYRYIACSDAFGIRPAITVDLTSDAITVVK